MRISLAKVNYCFSYAGLRCNSATPEPNALKSMGTSAAIGICYLDLNRL